jgi:hypothetical protein
MTEPNAPRYRVEIHLRNLRSCQIDFDSFSLIRCRIDKRSREMMAYHLPEKYVHSAVNTHGSLMFKFLNIPPKDDCTYAASITVDKLEAFVRYTNGHAMLLASVTPKEYEELRESFQKLPGSEYGIEFDFEPHLAKRNYNCTGVKGKPIDGEFM